MGIVWARRMEARPQLLVVDDMETNLVAMRALLGTLDCDVVTARSGTEALAHLAGREFAAVLLDVQMPEMNGFDVAERARELPQAREVPIIFVTGILETKESLFRGYDSGAVDVLFKPLDPHVLVSKVEVFLTLYRTKRRLADEVAAHQRTLAELESFNYSVSHDLRAPLRPLIGFSQILLDDHGEALAPEARGLLERIASAARRMDLLIEDLLRLSRIGRARPSERPVDLAKLAHAIFADLRSADPGREVEVVCPDELPVRGDEPLLRIALDNLLRNAWKFTRHAASPRIEVGVRAEGAEPAYFVKDNGVGFDDRHAGKVFEPFRRLHHESEFEGTGVGLAIVERVIQRHGGRVWAEAAPGRGATFLFSLG